MSRFVRALCALPLAVSISAMTPGCSKVGGFLALGDVGTGTTMGTANANMSFFVTSRRVEANRMPVTGGNLGGVASADAFCQTLSQEALPGNTRQWAAYLSTTTVDARDRIGSGPWVNAAGTMVAADVNALHATPPSPALLLTETGELLEMVQHDVLTGSTPEGRRFTDLAELMPYFIGGGGAPDRYPNPLFDFSCADWTSDGNGAGETNPANLTNFGVVGHIDWEQLGEPTARSWNSSHVTACDQGNMVGELGDIRLYCFATGGTAPPPTDAGMATDTGTVADAGVVADSGAPTDSGVPLDSGAPADTGVPVDTGVPADTGVMSDTGVAMDSGVADDTGVAADTGVVADAGVAADATVAADTGVLDLVNMNFFITSTGNGANGGNFRGLNGADDFCQARAITVNSLKTWRAYLSTPTINARDRIGAGPWVNALGQTIAADVAGLHANPPDSALILDEMGRPWDATGLRRDVLTGSNSEGRAFPTIADLTPLFTVDGNTPYTTAFQFHCTSWTNPGDAAWAADPALATDFGAAGHADWSDPTTGGGTNTWNSTHVTACDIGNMNADQGDARLYCFAID